MLVPGLAKKARAMSQVKMFKRFCNFQTEYISMETERAELTDECEGILNVNLILENNLTAVWCLFSPSTLHPGTTFKLNLVPLRALDSHTVLAGNQGGPRSLPLQCCRSADCSHPTCNSLQHLFTYIIKA